MQVKHCPVEEMYYDEFADKYNLTLEIHERPAYLHADHKFYAFFEGCDIRGDSHTTHAYGNGNTITEAVLDYLKQISEHIMVRGPSSDPSIFPIPHLKYRRIEGVD